MSANRYRRYMIPTSGLAMAMLKRQLCEVKPVINHNRLAALCVTVSKAWGGGVQANLFPRILYYTQNEEMELKSQIVIKSATSSALQ